MNIAVIKREKSEKRERRQPEAGKGESEQVRGRARKLKEQGKMKSFDHSLFFARGPARND